MAQILGLGCMHWPALAYADEALTRTFRRTLESPACPPEYKQPGNWPAALREELGDDEGLTAARAYSRRLAHAFAKVRAELDAFQPDLVVIWGDDQYENFREDIIPPFCVLAYDEFRFQPWGRGDGRFPNRWNEPGDKLFEVAGHREAGRRLTAGLIARGIDMAYSYRPLHEPGLSHAFANTLLFLDWQRVGFPYPVLPIAVNCYGRSLFRAKGGLAALYQPGGLAIDSGDPPAPTPARCMEVGAAIADYFASSPYRVALIASASWSHAFLTPRHGYLFPDFEADRTLFQALAEGRYEVWAQQSSEAIEQAGQHEVLNWMMLAGAMRQLGRRPSIIDYVESHLFTSQKCFAVFRG